ncbi:MAG: TROVE domain-containing protein [Saprospiraceae bacterium]|nr:TROVE domain-containing protein [Saprospiraceae bacterium]
MAPFNLKRKKKDKVVLNHMGARAYKYEEKFALAALLLTSFAQNSYYRKGQDTFKDLITLLKDVPADFAAKAAIYARDHFNMRSITHVLAAELSAYASGTAWAKHFYDKVVVRPDDMLEIVAYLFQKGQKTLPNAMKKGFAKAFDRFDAYQLAKYRKATSNVKLVDLVNLVHPIPTQANAKALQDLVAGTLRNTQTWEAKISKAGQGEAKDKKAAKQEAWEDMILSKRLGYMALLRNLRNLIQAELSKEAFDQMLGYLSNRNAVLRSRQLPFRFLSAYAEIEALKKGKTKGTLVFEKDAEAQAKQYGNRVDRVLKAIEAALNHSVANLPLLEGETVILSDNSGSMRGDYGGSSATSAMSKRTTADIANLFAAMYWSRCDNTCIGLFGDRLITPKLNRSKGILENFKTVHREGGKVGGGTETGVFTMFEKLIKERRKVARIVIFSDMQIGTGCGWYDTGGRRGNHFNALYEKYLKINPDVRVFSVDLRGYGTTVFKGNVYKLAGWSEKIFDLMQMAEQDKDALITAIDKIEF